MTGPAADSALQQRLLTFELGGSAYALPIGGVLEVSEVEPLACIPTLALGLAGVVNHHGDALPVVDGTRLLGLDRAVLPDPRNLLVVCPRPDGARLGIPVDRVLGLVDGPAPARNAGGPVADRRSIDGRLVNVLDPESLVERARQVVERVSGLSD